jgi:hypothetical protein
MQHSLSSDQHRLASQEKLYNLLLVKATFFEKRPLEFESFFDLKQQPNAFSAPLDDSY